MSPTIPPSFLFHFQLPLPRADELPRSRGRLLGLQNAPELFVPARLNNEATPVRIRAAWNPRGLGVLLQIRGRRNSPAGRWKDPGNSDWIHILVDTRHTAAVQRATEFCSLLTVLPLDDDADDQPSARFIEIAQLAVLDRVLLLVIILSVYFAFTNRQKDSSMYFLAVFLGVWALGAINGTLGVNFRYQLPVIIFGAWVLLDSLPRSFLISDTHVKRKEA
jgi:hypothetical protein